MAEEETISWFAGVDWGSERHQVCLLDDRGITVGEREFPHSGEGLTELGDWLLSLASAASTVAVAIVPHGPVVDALIDRGFVVYAINPKQLDRLRHRFSVAGAKDDRRDAYVQADGLRTDRRLFRRLQVADPRLIELRAWSRLAEELQAERVRLSNRVRHQLWRYYPQMQKLPNVRMILVNDSADAADDWIAERVSAVDVCVTSDIPLASRCLKRGARVVSPTGHQWTQANIGNALAGREVARYLRELGATTRGPAPLTKRDRSRFLSALDTALQAALRQAARS
jgi:uncharacterized protein YaiI (UPF0178 family)